MIWLYIGVAAIACYYIGGLIYDERRRRRLRYRNKP